MIEKGAPASLSKWNMVISQSVYNNYCLTSPWNFSSLRAHWDTFYNAGHQCNEPYGFSGATSKLFMYHIVIVKHLIITAAIKVLLRVNLQC